MVVRHYLNGTEISEPIGFDNLKMKMKRGDYHGISAEVSEQALEFYGTAAEMIREAYSQDLDTVVTYSVTTDGEEMYSGVLDLSTYEEQRSDYCSVSCKVGEVGVKTTFNNRSEVEVDMNGTKTIDGNKLTHSFPWVNLKIPQKDILYINKLITESDCPVVCGTNTDGKTKLIGTSFQNFISLFPCKVQYNEYGTLGNLVNVISGEKKGSSNINQRYEGITFTDHNDMKLWERNYGEEWDNQYGNASTHTVIADLKVKLKFLGNIFSYTATNGDIVLIPWPENDWKLHCRLILVAGNTLIAQGEIVDFYDNASGTNDVGVEKTLTLNCKTTASINDTLILGIEFTHTTAGYTYFLDGTPVAFALNLDTEFQATILQGSYVETQMFDDYTDSSVSADFLFVHEALNKISETISENALTVKSNLYSRNDSVVNAHTPSGTSEFEQKFGLGALRVITNGYKIRELYTDGDQQRNMPISFKTMMEALNAIDCIGWGFSEEDGKTYIRVERWSWFYQTGSPILSITAPKEVKTAIDTSMVITELKIGYKKYNTNEDFAAIDNIMSERTFTTNTKAISNSVSKLCEFIADNYAIELTRRAATTLKSTEEFKYDENIFIFSVWARFFLTQTYFISPDIVKADSSLHQYEKTYNAKISPARNAYRWIDRLFCVAGLKPFVCTAGTVNYKALITTKTKKSTTILDPSSATNYYTPDPVNTIPSYTYGEETGVAQNAENLTLRERYYKTYQDISNQMKGVESDGDLIIPRIFKAETIEFSYPLSVAEYKKVKANPYGLIEVDGVLGWIKEFTYSFVDGTATFKLIPKAD